MLSRFTHRLWVKSTFYAMFVSLWVYFVCVNILSVSKIDILLYVKFLPTIFYRYFTQSSFTHAVSKIDILLKIFTHDMSKIDVSLLKALCYCRGRIVLRKSLRSFTQVFFCSDIVIALKMTCYNDGRNFWLMHINI